MRLVSHDIVRHAGHYLYIGGGYDLELWMVAHPIMPTLAQLSAVGVSDHAVFANGALTDGEQRWVYTAKLKLSPGTCPVCAPPTQELNGDRD